LNYSVEIHIVIDIITIKKHKDPINN